MPLRISKRLPLLPGLRANISKSGVSLFIGHRGAWLTFGPRGRRATLGIPGTGVYWTETAPPARPVHGGHQFVFVLLLLLPAADRDVLALRSASVDFMLTRRPPFSLSVGGHARN